MAQFISASSVLLLVLAISSIFYPAVNRSIVMLELVIMCGWVMYDTRAMMDNAEAGAEDIYTAALLFFLDFLKMLRKVSKLKMKKK